MWTHLYLLEPLIAEYAADRDRAAARDTVRREPESLRRRTGETLGGRLRPKALALFSNRRIERTAAR